jgi:hypothetical protein
VRFVYFIAMGTKCTIKMDIKIWAGDGLVSVSYFYVFSVKHFDINKKAFKGWIQIIQD